MTTIQYEDFSKVDMRIGRIIEAKEFPKAKKSAYKLKIDFGDLGIKNSSAQITVRYNIESLVGKKVVAVVNFPPKQIADFVSEVLVLGVSDANGSIMLLTSDHEDAVLGARVY